MLAVQGHGLPRCARNDDDSGFAVANPQAKWKRWVVAGEAHTHSKFWSQN